MAPDSSSGFMPGTKRAWSNDTGSVIMAWTELPLHADKGKSYGESGEAEAAEQKDILMCFSHWNSWKSTVLGQNKGQFWFILSDKGPVANRKQRKSM